MAAVRIFAVVRLRAILLINSVGLCTEICHDRIQNCAQNHVCVARVTTLTLKFISNRFKTYFVRNYEGHSNENLKSAIKNQNTARLSCKLTIMILIV
jgi:hypothetical protein